MHFVILVVTEQKPTEEILAKALEPFADKWDGWWLGGRWSGNLIPYDIDNTITGGPNVPDAELVLQRLARQSGCSFSLGTGMIKTGPGCDALQLKNLKRSNLEFLAVVLNGKWHQAEVTPVEDLFRSLQLHGVDVRESPGQFDTERVALERWRLEFDALMDQVLEEHWVSAVDCHT
jgi:hypothetical protein